MTDNATSATTSTERSRAPALDAVAFEPPCFNASDRSSREAQGRHEPEERRRHQREPEREQRTVVSIRARRCGDVRG